MILCYITGVYITKCYSENIAFIAYIMDPLTWIYPIKHVHGFHDDVIKWKHFPRYWPFLRGIHRSAVNSTQKGQWRGALMFSSIWVWINGWVNNREASDLRRYRAHYGVIVMMGSIFLWFCIPIFLRDSIHADSLDPWVAQPVLYNK